MGVVPQLDFVTYPSQIFWFLCSFLFLYIIVRGFVVPRIEGVIKERYLLADESVCSSYAMCDILSCELSRQHELLSDAESKAKLLVEKALAETKHATLELGFLLKEELEEMFNLARDRLEQMELEARDELMELSVEIAAMYCVALSGKEVEGKDRLRDMVAEQFLRRGYG